MRHLRPSLYRKIRVREDAFAMGGARAARRVSTPLIPRPRPLSPSQVVMSDGATFHVPSAVRMVSKTLQLERDPANHPIYLVRDTSGDTARIFIPASHHAWASHKFCVFAFARRRARVTRWG